MMKLYSITIMHFILLLYIPFIIITSVKAGRSFICISDFTTSTEIDNLPYKSSITDLIQSISPITVGNDGTVNTGPDWPLSNIVNQAHGNGTKIWTSLKLASASDFLMNNNKNTFQMVSKNVINLLKIAKYDGIQFDIEGLKFNVKDKYEDFVKAFSETLATDRNSQIEFSTTYYGIKLLENEHAPTAYNISKLSSFGNIFIMAYDMSWYGLKPKFGWKQASPNAPLNGLQALVKNAINRKVNPGKLILGLPLYGRIYICDGEESNDQYGNCTCKEKNFKKKSLDILNNIWQDESNGCNLGYNEISATPFWECNNYENKQQRTQGWFENSKSLNLKINLASNKQLMGIGAWTAHGIAGGTKFDSNIWNLITKYILEGVTNKK